MQRLFEPEITAWKEAQEAGLTLVDHVVATGTDLVTPASDDELELGSLDDDDADDDAPQTSLDTQVGTVEVAETIELDEATYFDGPPVPRPPETVVDETSTSLLAPRRDRSRSPSLESTPVPIVIRHISSGPVVVDVTTYPSIQSDPSYVTISRDRAPEAPPASPRRVVIWLLVLAGIAVLAGIGWAVIASRG
jgi:hypothetical protein